MTGETTMIGLILAGGQAQRLGGDGKAHLMIGQEAMIDRTVSRLRQQCTSIILNLPPTDAVKPAERLPVVYDGFGHLEGPLSGLLAGLDWIASEIPTADYVLTTPVDSPFLPSNFAQRLIEERCSDNEVIVAASGGRIHPLHAIWPTRLRSDLRTHLENNVSRKVTVFQERYCVRHVSWDIKGFDPFFNINTPDDLAYANEVIAAHPEI